jgi:ribose/xylose/arabinose/galactoside ABC-type transport system permease subunit
VGPSIESRPPRILEPKSSALRRFLRSGPGGVALLIALETVVFSLWTWGRSPAGEIPFLTPRALTSLLEATTVYAFLALAQAPVMIAGGIDLSVGSTLALGQCVCAALITTDPAWHARGFPGLPGWCGVLGGVAAGALFGLLNGVLAGGLRLAPFLLTLGTLSAGRGLSILLSGSRAIGMLPGHQLPGDSYHADGVGVWERFGKPNLSALRLGPLDVYLPTLLLVVVATILGLFLARSRRGRIAYAIGGNEEASRLAGLPIVSTKLLLYTLAGALAGSAGVLSAYQYGTFDPQAGMGYELGAVAACVLGGVSLTGGTGGVLGPLLGALLFAALRKGLNQTGVGGEWSELAVGLVIVAALGIDRLRLRAGAAP